MNFRHLNRLEKQKNDPHKAEQERVANEAREAKELLDLERELEELEIQERFEGRLKMDQRMALLEEEMRVSLGLAAAKAEAQKEAAPAEVPVVLATPKPRGKWKTKEQLEAGTPAVRRAKHVRKVRGAGEHREVVVITAPEPVAPAPKQVGHKPASVTVRIGVQKGGVGPVQSYTFVHMGLVGIEIARMLAVKAAKAEGLHFCWYIEEIVET